MSVVTSVQINQDVHASYNSFSPRQKKAQSNQKVNLSIVLNFRN